MRALLIEDDPLLGESIKEYLESQGFIVKWEFDDSNIDQYYCFDYFDIIILDLMLKYKSGETILRYIRKVSEVPVIISTAKCCIDDKEDCFTSGADDYLVKPYEPKELLLRINNILRKKGLTVYLPNNIEIDISSKTLKKDGKEIKLTQKEWELLSLLIKNKGKIISHEYILNNIWGDDSVGTESIRTYIKRLRDILGDNSIETLKGRGYKIN
ncbi:MAG: response regulator transcription factor [Calditerrivibrio sp.]|nr:response regulator transcription factor [Calditerrivibrio sp.]MCA1933442.1 response regulator transcription factor [Calditerrivibrio sp.]MCA1980719.1 response regulator transcription factor [Calditerrivibrio sp.]